MIDIVFGMTTWNFFAMEFFCHGMLLAWLFFDMAVFWGMGNSSFLVCLLVYVHFY